MHAAAALIAALRSAGVRHLFGNPGTTELPFLDALDGSELHYVVGLQEATVVAAADGYAQATGEVGVANVHVAPGLANALSILHNAARAKPRAPHGRSAGHAPARPRADPGRRPREDGRAVHQVGVRDPRRRRGGQRAGARGHDRAHASDRAGVPLAAD